MTRLLPIGALAFGALAFALAAARADDDQAMLRRVQELLRAHQADVFGCVQKEARPPAGELLVRVFVGQGGHAERPEILEDQTGSATLGRCLTGRIRAWDLSPLHADPGDQIVFPLAFKPSPKQGSK